jgi:Phage integrase, N-terminal SAM-like domain
VTADTRKLHRTSYPGIYKRDGGGYVVRWRERRTGRERKDICRTLGEARELQGKRRAGDRRKGSRVAFAEYAREWIETYGGRTSRGFRESTRAKYREDIERRLVPYFGRLALGDVQPQDVRQWFRWLEDRGVSISGIRKAKATLSALFATAYEDGLTLLNPVAGVRYIASPKQTRRPSASAP